eukprot:TRINITY_DN17698_c0_g2_i1.p1 TRINITY_DN17698_c0_g2~~TRINITY_DN17698_c0_g2_i1.p1  ORF type:complete len:458 (+),score=54.86 TRINITY_DN17698_c0_g2_i1:79-1452(+)
MADERKQHLAFACVKMWGHLMPMVPYMQELSNRGHHVTLFCSDDPKWVEKLRALGLGGIEVVKVALPDQEQVRSNVKLMSMINQGGPMALVSLPLFDAITSHYGHGRSTTPLPTALVVDFFTTAAMDAGDMLGIPVIISYPNPLGISPVQSLRLVAPQLRGVSQKILAKICVPLEGLFARTILALRNRERKHRGLKPMVEQDIYPCDTMKRPMLGMWGFGFEYPFLHSPLLTYVGPSIPASYAPLTGDLAAWVEQQACPIVYVAFGTEHNFTEKDCRRLLSELEALSGVAVLWSLPATQRSMITPIRVRVESFVPQLAVLNHAKVSCFVSHCGGNSVSEAILNETPVVCCPGLRDQPSNAARIQSARVGIIAKGGVAGVGHAVRTILAELAGYQEKVRKLKHVLRSHGGGKRGADVIEAIGAVGYDHLVPHGQRMSLFRMLVMGVVLLYGGTWIFRK